jgi:hypothetical protein
VERLNGVYNQILSKAGVEIIGGRDCAFHRAWLQR